MHLFVQVSLYTRYVHTSACVLHLSKEGPLSIKALYAFFHLDISKIHKGCLRVSSKHVLGPFVLY